MRYSMILVWAILGLSSAHATFLPEGAILAPSTPATFSNMTESEFKSILADIQNEYAPIVSQHGGQLKVSGNWADTKLNAGAMQFFNSWQVQITGGLARWPDLTTDGFILIVCHELGHHLAGFAFAPPAGPMSGLWAATEGQSDYFATQVCARNLWKDDKLVNAGYRQTATQVIQDSCNSVWADTNEQNLCYRVLSAVESMTLTMANLMKKPAPQFNTPDPMVVEKTNPNHPAVQCRMDTSLQGALCPAAFSHSVIPGKKTTGGVFGLEAEREAAVNSCTAYSNYAVGLRPACWFKARL